MWQRKRQGNLLITVMVFIMLTIIFAGIFSTVVAQKNSAIIKARTAGDVNSYITLCNICAGAFKDDLEGQSVNIIVASVENPDGSIDEEYVAELYDEAITKIQESLKHNEKNDSEMPEAWFHTLENPRDALDYEGITHEGVLETADRLLENATVSIKVLGPMRANQSSFWEIEDAQSSTAVIDDILFEVVLKKGTTKVVQNYCLKNEKIAGRFDESGAHMTVQGDTSELILQSQTVTRKNIETST